MFVRLLGHCCGGNLAVPEESATSITGGNHDGDLVISRLEGARGSLGGDRWRRQSSLDTAVLELAEDNGTDQ